MDDGDSKPDHTSPIYHKVILAKRSPNIRV